jgi:hypothetical protein
VAWMPSAGGNGASAPAAVGAPGGAPRFLEACLAAVHQMDTRSLEGHLNRAAMALNPAELVDDVVVPLLNRIGLLWEVGEVSPGIGTRGHGRAPAIPRFPAGHVGSNRGMAP